MERREILRQEARPGSAADAAVDPRIALNAARWTDADLRPITWGKGMVVRHDEGPKTSMG